MLLNFCRLRPRDYSREVSGGGFAEPGEAAESAEELLGGALTDAGDVGELGMNCPRGAALTVEADGKPMRFVAHLLN